MPNTRHTDAEKLKILAEADAAPRGYRGTSGKAVVCAKHGISVSTLTLWRKAVRDGKLKAEEAAP